MSDLIKELRELAASEEVADRAANEIERLQRENEQLADDDTLRYIQSLEQQLAEAKRDAARYRWLRDHDLMVTFDNYNQSIDAAIDQAMREGE